MTSLETGDPIQSTEHDPSSSTTNQANPVGSGPHPKRSNRFRFKSEHSRGAPHRSRSRSPESRSHNRHRRRLHHRHHHRQPHRHRERSRSPSPLPDTDTAFRLSLFDALGDDEGAAYWEGVYGQPIHTYSDQKAGPDGELERMTDEEYAAYVRRRMWEKSYEGIEAERKAKANERRDRERREQERHKRRRKQAEPRQERELFEFEIEVSLKRGEKRKRDKEWRQLWNQYLNTWADLNTKAELLSSTISSAQQEDNTNISTSTSSSATRPLHTLLPWPTESTRRHDISHDEVSRFFRKAVSASTSDEQGNDPQLALMTALKTERVRWHPDKIQHRYSRLGVIDQISLEGITAVFQIVDGMWNEERERR